MELENRFDSKLLSVHAIAGNRCRTPAIRGANVLVERIGIEPMTPCLQSRCSPS